MMLRYTGPMTASDRARKDAPTARRAEQAGAAPAGRRERKKAATRKAISDAATQMFLDRGFDAVSIREIAEEADVSPTTVFAYFPQKEALVFDEDESISEELVAVVRNRRDGQSIADAFHEHFRADIVATRAEHGDNHKRFLELVASAPSLNDYGQRLYQRYEGVIADAIAEDAGLAEPTDEIAIFARLVLQLDLLATASDHPVEMLSTGFALLRRGWEGAGTAALAGIRRRG